jgi:hypothetical protein
MFRDGTYAAFFRTPRGEGMGTVHFAEGALWGADSILTYSGSYDTDGEHFTASVTTTRHTAGHATVFGVDQLHLKLTGTSNGKVATCTGMADEAPGMLFEATLILVQDQPSPAPVRPQANRFAPRKLAKLPGGSRPR